jgi:hypothetical protein
MSFLTISGLLSRLLYLLCLPSGKPRRQPTFTGDINGKYTLVGRGCLDLHHGLTPLRGLIGALVATLPSW